MKQILPKVSPDFKSTLLSIRADSLLAEHLLHGVMPPVGRQQNLVFEDSAHQDWYTATLYSKLFNEKKA